MLQDTSIGCKTRRLKGHIHWSVRVPPHMSICSELLEDRYVTRNRTCRREPTALLSAFLSNTLESYAVCGLNRKAAQVQQQQEIGCEKK